MERSKNAKKIDLLNVPCFEGIQVHFGNIVSGPGDSLRAWAIENGYLQTDNTPDDLNFSHPQPFGGGNIIC